MLLQVRPNFIASTEDYRVTCKHGDVECAGNIQQLCMYRYASQTAFWKFVLCQNDEPSSIGQVSFRSIRFSVTMSRVHLPFCHMIWHCGFADHKIGMLYKWLPVFLMNFPLNFRHFQLSLAEHCLGQISSEYISEEAAGRARQCWSSREGKERLRESADFTWSEGVTK